ncbi:MAG TPA: radical SAM protein [Candidatus Hydrogenedentes bacterium]|nr:radical SAM protein [Candidatus Hydrogenedentota bacterium]
MITNANTAPAGEAVDTETFRVAPAIAQPRFGTTPGQEAGLFDTLQTRILTHWTEARMILDHKMPAPRTAIVYPTYVCNQDCLWCEYNAENTNKNLERVMSKERLFKLADDLYALGVLGVEFGGGGEPTLHPHLAELVRIMKGRGTSIGLLTNGTKLKGELASALVDCASYVRVGFDGATPETANRVKRPKTPEARFEAVCENIAHMLALRKERGTSVRISIKVVLDSNNYHEIEDCVRLAVRLGVDSVQFKAARLVASELNPEQAESVNTQMQALRLRYPQMPIVGGTEKVTMTTHCWLTPLQLTVDPMGEVYLCCYYRHRKERHSIGNCFEKPLHDLWYSEEHWQAIQGIQPHECNNLDCRFVKYNQVMDEAMRHNDMQYEFI